MPVARVTDDMLREQRGSSRARLPARSSDTGSLAADAAPLFPAALLTLALLLLHVLLH